MLSLMKLIRRPRRSTSRTDGRRAAASVTIYLSLSFLSIAALIYSLAEIARTAGSKYYMQVMADASIDSLFSEYDIELWNNYRLLLLHADSIDAMMKLESYAKPYATASNWFHMSEPEIDIGETVYITDDGGIWLEQEILDYMKYGIVQELFASDTEVQRLWDDLKDAACVKAVTNEYAGQTREAVALEKVLIEITRSIDRQEMLKKKAYAALIDGDTSSYHAYAGELKTLCGRMPNLVRNYIQKADRLGEKLDEISARYQPQVDELGGESAAILQDSVREYRTYTDADGARRKEIENQTQIAADNLKVLAETEEKIDEAEAEIAEGGETYEYEDEYGNTYTETEPVDEGPIWRRVAEYFDSYRIVRPDCASGLGDEEKEGFLESAKDILSGDLLQLVIPEGRTVSAHTLVSSELPGTQARESRDEVAAGVNRSLLDRILICEYTAQFFADFTDDQNRSLQYELEYIANGRRSDKDNLSESLSRIFMIREGMNYLTILKSSSLQGQADALAATIVGATGLPALKPLMKCLIMGVWAGAESVTDLRALLKGEKVALVKNDAQWKTSLTQVLDTGSSGKLVSDTKGDANGQSYEDYLKFLILMEDMEDRNYRMMDVIQNNICAADSEYRIRDAVYGMEVTFLCECPRLFTNLGVNHPSAIPSSYTMTVVTQKEY